MKCPIILRSLTLQVTFLSIVVCNCSLVASLSLHHRRQKSAVVAKPQHYYSEHYPTKVSNRRSLLQWSLLSGSTFLSPSSAMASDSISQNDGMLSTTKLADLLHPIPTFTLVDKRGVPFMVVGEDAKVTGYFFTDFNEAERILQLAKNSAENAIQKAKEESPGEEVGINPWNQARISTVPLDFAVTMVSRSEASKGGGNYFKLAPAEADVEDALVVTGKADLAEGKVPLFYYSDFTITNLNGQAQSPLYFRQSELEEEFRRLNPAASLPKVMVTELFSVLAEMVKPGGSNEDLKTLVFMKPQGSEERKNQCEKRGGKAAPFFIGQRIIVL